MFLKRPLVLLFLGGTVCVWIFLFSTQCYEKACKRKARSVNGISDHAEQSREVRDEDSFVNARIFNLSEVLLNAERHITGRSPLEQRIGNKSICNRYFSESHYAPKLIFRSVWTDAETKEHDVTLVLVMTPSKLGVLDKVLANWPGPVSVGLYVGEMEPSILIQGVLERQLLLERKLLEFGIVAGSLEFMPINIVRQVALDQVRTSHVALFDVDLVPSESLYASLLELIPKYTRTEKVLVIPSFEVINQKIKFVYPKTKSDLIDYLDLNVVQPFLFSIFVPSHNPTNFTKWRTADEIYSVPYEFGFEPYIFADLRELPDYDLRYIGRFYNKISYFCQLFDLKFQFDVMADGFAIHLPHPRGNTLSKEYEPCVRKMITTCMNKAKQPVQQ